MTIKQATPAKQGVRARERNALERLDVLEKDLINVAGSVQGILREMDQRLAAMAEVLDSAIEIVGPDAINDRLVEKRKARVRENAEKGKVAVAEALANGKLKALETVEDGCFLTGVEYDKEDKVEEPGYTQLEFSSVKAEYAEKLKGQKIGFKLDTENGGKFEITGIYMMVEPEVAPAPPAPVEEAKDA